MRVVSCVLCGMCVLTLAVEFAAYRSPRLDDSTVSGVAGGSECWALGLYMCGTASTCASQTCSWTIFGGYYCPGGATEDTPLPYFYCTQVDEGDEGSENCFADQSRQQQCQQVQACSTSCNQSTLTGISYCGGPTGPTFITFYFPVHYLDGDECPPLIA